MIKMNLNKAAIPKKLRKCKQWVAWQYGPPDKNGRKPKVPINPKTGKPAKTNDPNSWGSFKKAYRRYKEDDLDGIGFVFSKSDPFCGIDLDNCRNPETGEIENWALKVIRGVNSYTEVSPSCTGIKIFAEGKLPVPGRKSGNIEMYDNGKYFTVTGQCLDGFPRELKKKPQTIKKIYNEFFKEKTTNGVTDDHTSPCLLSDEEIPLRALSAANGENFKRLWEGDQSGYDSHSEADLALCNMLAYWTGRDRMRIDSLFRQSGLRREKWEKRPDYRRRTIDKAIASCREVFDQDPTEYALNVSTKTLESVKSDPKTATQTIIDDVNVVSALVLLSERRSNKYESFLRELRDNGVTVRDIDSIRRVVNSERKKRRNGDILPQCADQEPVTVTSKLPNAPVSDKVLIPPGWVVNNKGVFKGTIRQHDQISKEQIAPSPVLIQGHLKNMTDGTENIRLAWLSHGGWETHTVSRLDIADSRSIVKLADIGCPVTSVTAHRMVDYLSAFEATNVNSLPRATVTHQMGWQGKDMDAFLWGKNLISPDGKLKSDMNIEKMPPDKWPKKMIFFKGHDQGEDEIAKGFHKKGEFEKWKEIEPLIEKYPLVTFSIYAALSPPLLDILDASIFVVDWAFSTSRGKTTSLKIAGSCWGEPDMNKPGSIVKSWNATRVWIERAQAVLQSLPLILDDTKMAKYPQMVSQLLYDSVSGQGRGRGSIQGVRPKGSWRTILLSCGESKAVNFTAGDGGAHARVLSLWGSPFGKRKKAKAKLIRRLTKIIHKNYGHAGYRFVCYLIRNRDKWDEYRKKYSELTTYYQDQAGSYEVAQRQCEYYAVIHLAAILANKALGLTIDYERHLEKVFKKVITETSEANRAKEALQEVLSWALSNKDSFWMHGHGSSKQPFTGWLGVLNPSEKWQDKKTKADSKSTDREWDDDDTHGYLLSVAFIPHQLERFLKTQGYESKAITRTWKDNGWLDVSGEKKGLTKKVLLDGGRPRCYVIPSNVVDKMNR
jgi:primase-polymerase (primpol)-like protein